MTISIRPKKSRFIMDKKGITFKEKTYVFPVKVGRLKRYKNAFKDVVIELYRKRNGYYLNFYDRRKGLVGVAKISKLDAYNLVRSRLSKLGYDDDMGMSSERFSKLISSMDIIFIDQ